MSKTRSWLALVLMATLVIGVLAPSAAHARRSDRPTDTPDGPPLQYGDPEPGGGGSPMIWEYLAYWRQILVASMRIQHAMPIEPARVSKPYAGAPAAQADRGRNP